MNLTLHTQSVLEWKLQIQIPKPHPPKQKNKMLLTDNKSNLLQNVSKRIGKEEGEANQTTEHGTGNVHTSLHSSPQSYKPGKRRQLSITRGRKKDIRTHQVQKTSPQVNSGHKKKKDIQLQELNKSLEQGLNLSRS